MSKSTILPTMSEDSAEESHEAASLGALAAVTRWMRRWLFPKHAVHAGTFARELESQIDRVLLPGALLALTAWLPYVWLDQMLSPQAPVLPFLRVGLTGVSVLVLLLRYFAPNPPRATLLAALLVGYVQVGAAFMAGITGAASEYVGGYGFLLMLAPALPLPRRYSWRCLGLASLTFCATAWLSGAELRTMGQMYTLTDLGVATITSVFLVWVLDATRERSWRRSTRLAAIESLLHDEGVSIAALQAFVLPPAIAKIARNAGVSPTMSAYSSACVVAVQPVGLQGLHPDINPLATWRALEYWLAWTDRVMGDSGFVAHETLDGGRVFIASATASPEAQGAAVESALLAHLPSLHEQMRGSELPAVRLQIEWRVGPVGVAAAAHRRFAFDVWQHTVYQTAKVVASAPHQPLPSAPASALRQADVATRARENPDISDHLSNSVQVVTPRPAQVGSGPKLRVGASGAPPSASKRSSMPRADDTAPRPPVKVK